MDVDIAQWIDIGLIVVGGVMLSVTVTIVTARRRWRSALSCVPMRSDRIDLVHLAVVVLLFMSVMMGMNHLGRMLEPPGNLSQDQWMGTESVQGFWPILAGTAAKVITAVLLCVGVAVTMAGGLSRFGLRPQRLRRDLVWAGLGYLMIWPVCAGIAYLIVWCTGRPAIHGVLNLLRYEGLPVWGTVALWISGVLVSPVAEELFFRGLLQTVIRSYVDRPWLAIGLAAIAFGLVHHFQPQYVVPLTVLGLALGYVYEHTGSLVAPILIHVLFNVRTIAIDLLQRSG